MYQLYPVFGETTCQFVDDISHEIPLESNIPTDIATTKMVGWWPFFGHFSKEPPALEPPLVRDEVVILVGPDKGKTGRVLWVARVDGKAKCLGATRWGDGVGA